MGTWVAQLHHVARQASTVVQVDADDEATAREYVQHRAPGFDIVTIAPGQANA